MTTKAKEGMRVQVYSTDRADDLGVGTIEKVEELGDEETGWIISFHYPSRIVLDSGEITEGVKCWWIPVEDVEKTKTKTDKKEEWERIKAQYSPEFGDMICDLFECGFTKMDIEGIVLSEIAKISKDTYEE